LIFFVHLGICRHILPFGEDFPDWYLSTHSARKKAESVGFAAA
jgi:hypothetical protein